MKESKEVVGLHAEIWETDLSKFSRNYETLLDIVPQKDGEIKIECIGAKNCEITEIKYIISDFQAYIIDGKLDIRGMDIFGKTYEIQTLFPKPNPNKITIYQFDKSINQFVNITLNNSTNATNIIFFTDLPCNKEGKVYIHPLGT